MVPDPFLGELLVRGHGEADAFDLASNVAGCGDDTGSGGCFADHGEDRVRAWEFGNEGAVGKDLPLAVKRTTVPILVEVVSGEIERPVTEFFMTSREVSPD